MRLRLGKTEFAGWVGSCCHVNSRVGFIFYYVQSQTAPNWNCLYFRKIPELNFHNIYTLLKNQHVKHIQTFSNWQYIQRKLLFQARANNWLCLKEQFPLNVLSIGKCLLILCGLHPRWVRTTRSLRHWYMTDRICSHTLSAVDSGSNDYTVNFI